MNWIFFLPLIEPTFISSFACTLIRHFNDVLSRYYTYHQIWYTVIFIFITFVAIPRSIYLQSTFRGMQCGSRTAEAIIAIRIKNNFSLHLPPLTMNTITFFFITNVLPSAILHTFQFTFLFTLFKPRLFLHFSKQFQLRFMI